MYVKMDNLDIYNDSAIILERKTPKKVISWITILIILLVLFIIFSFFPFNIYKPVVGYVAIDGHDSYIVLSLSSSDFPVNKYNKIYVKNKMYNYEIVSIEDNKLIIKANLEDSIRINNNVLTVNILKDRTTLFKFLKNKIKKGFEL